MSENDPLKVGLMMPVHGRPKITRAVARHYANMQSPFCTYERVAVCSSVVDGASVRQLGWDVVYEDNRPLSHKHNAGVKALREKGVDAVANIGSDVLISPLYFAFAAGLIQDGELVVRFADCLYYDVPTGRAFLGKPAYPGAGTVLSADVLEALEWRPWPGHVNRYLDTLLYGKLSNMGVEPLAIEIPRNLRGNAHLVELKGENNIWGYDAIMEKVPGVHPVLDPAQYFQQVFPNLWKRHAGGIFANARTSDQEGRTA